MSQCIFTVYVCTDVCVFMLQYMYSMCLYKGYLQYTVKYKWNTIIKFNIVSIQQNSAVYITQTPSGNGCEPLQVAHGIPPASIFHSIQCEGGRF